jgi:hypothetical protein
MTLRRTKFFERSTDVRTKVKGKTILIFSQVFIQETSAPGKATCPADTSDPSHFHRPDPEHGHPPNLPFSPFPLLRVIEETICQPNGNKQAGFSLGKIGYSGFHAIKQEIGEMVIKNAPFRPVAAHRLKSEYA